MSVRNAKKVVKQVRKLQDIMKGNANPSAEAFTPVLADVGQLVRDAVAFLKPLYPKIRLTARVAPDLPNTYADADQIQQMIVNLYDNSVEAITEDGNETGSIDISVLWNPDDPAIMIIYSDDGPGIPDELVSHVFEPGFTTKEGAEGVGLAECRVVARNHNGDILCRPGQKQGVLFSIRIPVVENQPEQ